MVDSIIEQGFLYQVPYAPYLVPYQYRKRHRKIGVYYEGNCISRRIRNEIISDYVGDV